MASSPLPRITLEQWAAFKAVVDEGSFAKAAELLNKSQSSISYAVNRLNGLLATPVLEPRGRKTVLTPAGAALYRHAEQLLKQAYATEQTARYLAGGWESNLTVVIDALCPLPPVMCALQAVSARCPSTRVKVLETSLSGTDEALLQRECNLALTPRVPPGFLGQSLTRIRMIPVAAKSHPLASCDRISEAELRTHRQVVVRDSGTRREQDAGWLGAEQRWTVSHFSTSIEVVLAGLGFAFVPHHRVEALIAGGQLRHLDLEIGNERWVDLNLVIADPDYAGPATRALAQSVQSAFQKSLTGGKKPPRADSGLRE